MKLTLRFITLLCYSLPCSFFMMTCNDFELHIAYNQQELDSIAKIPSTATKDTAINDKTADSSVAYHNDSLPKQALDNSIARNGAVDSVTKESWLERLEKKLFFPTETAASGFGAVIVFKNLVGQAAMAICILASLVLLVLFRWLKKPKVKMILLLIGIFSLLVFVVDSLISHVTILFGVWVLLALHASQYWIERKEFYSLKNNR